MSRGRNKIPTRREPVRYCDVRFSHRIASTNQEPWEVVRLLMRTLITLFLTVCVAAPLTIGQEIICVNGNATPPEGFCRDITLPTGQVVKCAEAVPESITGNACWDNAYIDLQDALDEAAALADQGSLVEIWVAAGVYHPDRGTGDRTMTFSLHKNVELYGGFAGWESFRFQRNFVKNKTILSGDLNEDDDPHGSYDGGISNCCIGHGGLGCDDPVCEALLCPEDSPRENVCCTRTWDFFCAAKAAQRCCNTCSTRNDCDNALHVIEAHLTDTTAVIDGLTIMSGKGNEDEGAGMNIIDGGATLRNCVFSHNVAGHASAVVARDSTVMVQHCKFIDNLLFPNTYTSAMHSHHFLRGSITVEDSIFSHNDGAGLGISDNKGTVRRTTFLENKGSGASVGGARATFDECRFIRNINPIPIISSGIDSGHFSHTTVKNCIFSSNEGGAAMDNNGFAALYNCLFLGNRSGGYAFANGFGGGAYMEHCAFVDNESGGVDVNQGIVEIKHCILWNNHRSGENTLTTQLFVSRDEGIARVTYSTLQGYDGPDGTFPGPGNNGADPMFVDEDGPDNIPGNDDDNLRLHPDSPLIDAGDPDVTLTINRDLDGHTRILCGRVDIGPYELGIGDFDCDGFIDLSDLADFPACMTNPGDNTTTAPCNAFDFNADKAIDLSDYAAMQLIVMTL